jgi:glutamyl-Q tRNA(Asp) synthetase
LNLPEPNYLHHPLITHADGRRLAKRDLAPTLAALREGGVDGRELAADLLAAKLPLGFAFSQD